jgi:hypothetical protein
MSGSGTSGRIAFFVARTFNKALESMKKEPKFHYLISGNLLLLFRIS